MKRKINLTCPWLAAESGTAKVLKWLVSEREPVEIDQDIMIMLLQGEEFLLPAPADGILEAILAEPGDEIEPDQVLAIIELDY